MVLPNTYTTRNDTGCCAVPDVEVWRNQVVEFESKHFIRSYVRSLMFVPVNMSKVMTELNTAASEAGVQMPPQEAMILSRDLSPWKSEQLYAVTKPVVGLDNVELSGTFATEVFEGSYNNAKKWFDRMQEIAVERGLKPLETYFFYTTCPKCAKHYGKNFVIGFVRLS